jgi:hypothetical protein
VLQKFGIGRWKKIQESGCLPGKSIGQIYMQTQRLVGQQSLAEFMGLHLDLESIFQDNMQKKGVARKNNTIVNNGDNQTKDERKRLIAENQQLYGLSEECVKAIRLPKSRQLRLLPLDQLDSVMLPTIEKLEHLREWRREIERKLRSPDPEP